MQTKIIRLPGAANVPGPAVAIQINEQGMSPGQMKALQNEKVTAPK